MQFAVNISDLSKDLVLAQFLIAPVILSPRTVIQAEKGKVDGSAVLLDCSQERLDGIIGIVRKKYSKNLFRFYMSKTGKGGWKRD